MNICITGALGHIGSKLIRNLTSKNIDVIHLTDNFLTQRYSSLFDLPANKKYLFHELNILDHRMEKIIRDSDIIIHLAAITDAETSAGKKALVNKVNKRGFKHVADLCLKYKKAIIFPSTTSVYGSQSDQVDETCLELKPQSPYAESKIWAENYLSALGKKKGLNYIIFRLGTIFGHSIGMRFHTAVNKFIFQAVNGQEITVWKTAYKQKRPYCDLDDAISAFNYAISHKLFNRQVYNIVTINSTVEGIVNAIKKYTPGLQIKFVDSRIMNQLSYDVDNSKSKKAGFKYTGNLDQSVRETIEKLKNVNFEVTKVKK
jgi:nucleoside-diphosphate-sugar epimerase